MFALAMSGRLRKYAKKNITGTKISKQGKMVAQLHDKSYLDTDVVPDTTAPLLHPNSQTKLRAICRDVADITKSSAYKSQTHTRGIS